MPSPPLVDNKQHCPRSTRIRSPIDKSIRYLKTLNSLANCLSRLLLLPLLCRIHFLPSIGSSSMAIQLFPSLLSQLDQSCPHKAKTGLSPPSAFLHPPQGTFLIMKQSPSMSASLFYQFTGSSACSWPSGVEWGGVDAVECGWERFRCIRREPRRVSLSVE